MTIIHTCRVRFIFIYRLPISRKNKILQSSIEQLLRINLSYKYNIIYYRVRFLITNDLND